MSRLIRIYLFENVSFVHLVGSKGYYAVNPAIKTTPLLKAALISQK